MVSQSLTVPEEKPKKGKVKQILRFSKYAILAMLVNSGIIFAAKRYVDTTPPTFDSVLVVNVSSGAGNVNLSLPSIGQAASSSKSNFSSHSDPRDNYKVLLEGKSVKMKAAEILGVPTKDLGSPRTSHISNTTTMKIEMSSNSAEDARKQVIAFYEGLYERLNELRLDEQIEKNKSIQKALLAAKEKLASEQKRVSNYKLTSGLNSSDQIKNLITNIESIRAKRSNLIGERDQTHKQIERLSLTLKLTPEQAADALTLQTDQQLNQRYSVYSDVTSEFNTLTQMRGPNYPDVIRLKEKKDIALLDSLERAKAILGRDVAERELEVLLLNNGTADSTPRGTLFQTLVEKDSMLKGIDGELKALQEQIKILESRLSNLTQKEAVLSNYLRELDIAEAVFAATLAKIDLGRGDIFAAYPLIQIFEEATVPIKPSAPQPTLIFVGAILACTFFTLALTLGWYRKECLEMSKKLITSIAA